MCDVCFSLFVCSLVIVSCSPTVARRPETGKRLLCILYVLCLFCFVCFVFECVRACFVLVLVRCLHVCFYCRAFFRLLYFCVLYRSVGLLLVCVSLLLVLVLYVRVFVLLRCCV